MGPSATASCRSKSSGTCRSVVVARSDGSAASEVAMELVGVSRQAKKMDGCQNLLLRGFGKQAGASVMLRKTKRHRTH